MSRYALAPLGEAPRVSGRDQHTICFFECRSEVDCPGLNMVPWACGVGTLVPTLVHCLYHGGWIKDLKNGFSHLDCLRFFLKSQEEPQPM